MSAPATAAAVCVVVAYAAFAVQSAVLAVVDARTHRLPDRLVLPGYPVVGALLTAAALLAGTPARLIGVVVGALGLFAFFFALRMLRPGAMGGGDVKLAGVVGAHTGWFGLEAAVVGAASAFVLGGVAALVLLALRRARRSDAIPFGPFLLAGAWAGIAVGVAAAG
ncbi:A24 family peptidase [Microbacterium sp. 10M-3C3]|jgi:leader peptidase (prepilin peptidase)/N-methyltransferase|uniref:prepilin peptidase n=1 Tax=Microbacterium sp. 10M-3C3 TaxID=2483401 RepID=UPI000F63BDD7|nr:A24 family peptidase [Microbacterium sp. 10M-3C3]